MSFYGTTFRTCRLLLECYTDSVASKAQYRRTRSVLTVGNLTLAIGYELVAFSLHRFVDIEIRLSQFTQIDLHKSNARLSQIKRNLILNLIFHSKISRSRPQPTSSQPSPRPPRFANHGMEMPLGNADLARDTGATEDASDVAGNADLLEQSRLK